MLRLLICLLAFWSSQAFGPTFSARPEGRVTALAAATSADTPGTSNMDASEIVARRIIVKGDVQGGYYRSCVRNEVRRSHAILPAHHVAFAGSLCVDEIDTTCAHYSFPLINREEDSEN
jgi:hypothetical protein